MGEALLVLVGPLLGLVCYVAGPVAAAASALVSLKPWWATPFFGILVVPVATILFTPVCGLCSSPLPMPLPWLIAAVVDSSAATKGALLDNGKVLAGIYSAALLLVISFRGLRYVLVKRSSNASAKSPGG